MANRGITITNYLVTGNPEGVILAYMSNWTGQAVKIPRNLFVEARDYEEIQRPGIYFLIGLNEDNPDDKLVYVGEANNISERLLYHFRDDSKSFFEVIIAFSSKDENLTVSHTKYLEGQVIAQLSKNPEFRLKNRKEGNQINLPRMVRDEMDTFFDNVKIILPTLGYNLLDQLDEFAINQNEGSKDRNLFLTIGNIKAKAVLTSNGILVEEGSELNETETNSLSGNYSNLRKTLHDKGIVKKTGSMIRFLEDFEFSSPSQAAAIILGYSINGRTAWKNKKGESLKEIEERLLEKENGN